MFFTPSQLKGEYRSCPLPSTFPSTVISRKIQSAGLVSQPLICLLPHIPAFSPTDPFIPSLHVHLQGKAWSPSLLPCLPHSHHRHAPGLPALVLVPTCPRSPCPCPGGIPSSVHRAALAAWVLLPPVSWQSEPLTATSPEGVSPSHPNSLPTPHSPQHYGRACLSPLPAPGTCFLSWGRAAASAPPASPQTPSSVQYAGLPASSTGC